MHFLESNGWISIKTSLKFVPKGPGDNIPALVQIMAWHRPGDKHFSESMMVRLPTHICVTRSQWVNIKSYLSYPSLQEHYSDRLYLNNMQVLTCINITKMKWNGSWFLCMICTWNFLSCSFVLHYISYHAVSTYHTVFSVPESSYVIPYLTRDFHDADVIL